MRGNENSLVEDKATCNDAQRLLNLTFKKKRKEIGDNVRR